MKHTCHAIGCQVSVPPEMLMCRTKICRECRQRKPLEEFHRNKSRADGRQSFCKPCHNKRAREWNAKNPEKYRERITEDPNYYLRQKLKHRYGLTLEQYTERLEFQNYRCAICNQFDTRNQPGHPNPLVVDHDHRTGQVRGLLCLPCNAALGMLERREWLGRAEEYLANGTNAERRLFLIPRRRQGADKSLVGAEPSRPGVRVPS